MRALRTFCLFVIGLLLGSHIAAQVIKDTKGGDETYMSTKDSPYIKTKENPSIRVALQVNSAAYSNIRRFLKMDVMVPFAAVRIEEMLNYFNINYTEPERDSVLSMRSFRTTCPWNNEKQLLYIQVNTKKIDLRHVPQSNLVFLIDVSGSMDLPNRLPVLKASFHKLVEYLRPTDTLSIVIYGGAMGIYLTPTSGVEKAKIHAAIDELSAGGTTPGEAGLIQAYDLAKAQFISNGNNRVILATDGDFNVGRKSEEELDTLITKMREKGIYLTCLGVGMGNYKDSKIEVLARKGNGNFAYLDTEDEGEKVLVKEFTQTLYTATEDTYLDLQFDSTSLNGYRLLGFNNGKGIGMMEGGEMGYGQSTMAIFEVQLNEHTLRDLGKVAIHYKPAHVNRSEVISQTLDATCVPFETAPVPIRFAASMALFGMMLRHNEYDNNKKWLDLLAMVLKSVDLDDPKQKEYVALVQHAQKIYVLHKRKKSKTN